MKKVLALALAAVMVMALAGSAMAAFALDPSVTVNGLIAGDTVRYYQVLEWDQANGAWKLATGFTGCGLTVANIVDGISQAEANAIAACANGATAKYTDSAISGTTSTYTLPNSTEAAHLAAVGLYMAIVTAGDPGYVYNPVFVSVDFDSGNATSTINASSATYDTAVAKKKPITVLKTTSDANSAIATAIDSKKNEEVTFYVDTTIPVFMKSYTQPRFVIEDIISDGIELVTGSIEVTLNGTEHTEYSLADTYEVVETGTQKYTVTFNQNYLKANAAPVTVHIEYKGTVTNDATFNVNEDENTVTVTYSNGPTTEAAALRDRTNHYTFSIGAQIFGAGEDHGKTYELVKVGVDAAGNPVVEKRQVSEWNTSIERHPLAGATFGLYSDAECTDAKKIAEFTTGEDGIITFLGLDASTYYIKELSAPGGYIKDDRTVQVVIAASYETVNVPATTDGSIEVAGYSFNVLDHYTVTVSEVSQYNATTNTYAATNNTVTSTYTYENDGKSISTIDDDNTTVLDSELENKKGQELPSTGGIGTTIFYVSGLIMVLGAATILVARRRADAE